MERAGCRVWVSPCDTAAHYTIGSGLSKVIEIPAYKKFGYTLKSPFHAFSRVNAQSNARRETHFTLKRLCFTLRASPKRFYTTTDSVFTGYATGNGFDLKLAVNLHPIERGQILKKKIYSKLARAEEMDFLKQQELFTSLPRNKKIFLRDAQSKFFPYEKRLAFSPFSKLMDSYNN